MYIYTYMQTHIHTHTYIPDAEAVAQIRRRPRQPATDALLRQPVYIMLFYFFYDIYIYIYMYVIYFIIALYNNISMILHYIRLYYVPRARVVPACVWLRAKSGLRHFTIASNS